MDGLEAAFKMAESKMSNIFLAFEDDAPLPTISLILNGNIEYSFKNLREMFDENLNMKYANQKIIGFRID